MRGAFWRQRKGVWGGAAVRCGGNGGGGAEMAEEVVMGKKASGDRGIEAEWRQKAGPFPLPLPSGKGGGVSTLGA